MVRRDADGGVAGEAYRGGLVPCAESGISTLVGDRPVCWCQARIISRPVSSPAAPAGGCRVAAAIPVMRHRALVKSHRSSNHPWAYGAGVAGCT